MEPSIFSHIAFSTIRNDQPLSQENVELSMCEGLKSVKYHLRVPPSDGAEALGEDDRETFGRLSSQTVSELIQEEPDTIR